MFFLLPIGFLKVFHRIPWANFAIIALCTATYVGEKVTGKPPYSLYLFPSSIDPADFPLEDHDITQNRWEKQPWSFVTHAFVHGGFLHLFGNMVFLFVFGSALNSEFGHFWYTLFFLVAAAIAGAAHIFLTSTGVIGASGAICAVTGAVAALYPLNEVRIFYFLWLCIRIFTGAFDWPAIKVVAIWFAVDVLFQVVLGKYGGVAYLAHISGTVLGFVVGLVALKQGWIVSDGYDFLSWYTGVEVKRKRRSKYAHVIGSHKHAALTVTPKPTPDFEPIPLSGDEEEPVAKPKPKGEKQPGKRLPAYELINRYFAANDLVETADIPDADAKKLKEWYERYQKVHAGATIAPQALLKAARLFVRENYVDFALDAYDRLVRQNPGQATAALEAAVFAAKTGKHSRAAALIKRALAGNLPSDQRRAALELQAKLERRKER